MVQCSHLYMTAGKTIALTVGTFVSKVMFLLFNMLSSFSSKEQASFNFMAAVMSPVILEPKKIKCITVSIFYLTICHKVMGLNSMNLFSFLNVEF